MARYGNNHVGEDHVGANPISGLMWELRRCAGNIVAIEEELGYIDAHTMVEGETTTTKRALASELREVIGAVDDEDDATPGKPIEEYTIVQRQQRIHAWNEMYMRERQQYNQTAKLMFAVGFEKKRLEMLQQNIADFNGAITGILRALGHDPNDPVVRQIVRQQIIAVMPPT